ncbi:MAG: hypothetical protein GF365_05610 [Candidatus Buchananbacteria bacterium]|nr:hypothetical protein [Candidatus Buchananbacteria bacterium]
MQKVEVIEFVKNGRVFELKPKDFAGRRMTIDEVEMIFGAFAAFWQYKGELNPQKPHALLKSGLHSNGFINCRAVLDYPHLCMILANEMKKAIEEKYPRESLQQIGGIASSAYSALDLGFCLAYLFSQDFNKKIKHIIVEKDTDGNPTMVRGGLDLNMKVLVINELMTTKAGSTWETKKAIMECNGNDPGPDIFSRSFVLMHRSKDFELADGSEVVPVFYFDIENYEPNDCPYCRAGSEAIKPKIDNNWNILHGKA